MIVKKRLVALMTLLAMSVSLLACGGESGEETNNADITEDQDVVAEQGEAEGDEAGGADDAIPEGMYRSELTNELIDERLKDQRPIAVMVDNESIALPHYGLSEADVVYEMMNSLENGRITRFMALYKDYESVEQIGSIRSARPTNLIISAEWNAILCHDGGPVYINQYLEEECVDNFSGTFSRVNNGKAREYTEYILTGDMENNFEKSDIDKEYNEYYEGAHYQFASESNPVDLGEIYDGEATIDVSVVDLPFAHNGSYLEYNEEDQLYYYSEYGEPHIDPNNDNQQLCFKNLLIQSCGYTQYDENGYMIFDCISSGYGYYVTNGEAIYVSWKKEDMTSPTRYYDLNGNEITLNTGKTYVALVPVDDWEDLVIE